MRRTNVIIWAMRRTRAVYRLNRLRAKRTLKSAYILLSHMHGLFPWRYSGALIFFLYALAFAMVGIGLAVEPFHTLFLLAHGFLSCSLIWAIGWWLTSGPLERKKPRLTKKQKKGQAPVSYRSYRAWQFGVSSLMVILFVFSMALVSQIESSRELGLLHGELIPANDPDPIELKAPVTRS